MWKNCELAEIQELKSNFITGAKMSAIQKNSEKSKYSIIQKKNADFSLHYSELLSRCLKCRIFRVIFKPYELKIQSNLDKIHRFF